MNLSLEAAVAYKVRSVRLNFAETGVQSRRNQAEVSATLNVKMGDIPEGSREKSSSVRQEDREMCVKEDENLKPRYFFPCILFRI